MSSAKLQQLERQLARSQGAGSTPLVATASGTLGAALELLIQQEVGRRVGEQQKPRSPRLRKVLDGFNQPAQKPWRPEGGQFDPAPEYHPSEDFGPGPEPAQRAWIAPAKREPVVATVQRDAAGLLRSTTIIGPGGKELVFTVERDAAGKVMRMVQEP